jgi:hypothetical protein
MKATLAAAAVLVVASPSLAGTPATELRRGTPCDWEALFRQGTADCAPAGPTDGTVLYADGKLPRLKARTQGIAWKGKNFHGDGSFTNRWLGGIQAVSSGVRVEPSRFDGLPCLVMQYAPNAPIFGNVRDELRQIAPDLWLGRSCDATTGQPKNWFVLWSK